MYIGRSSNKGLFPKAATATTTMFRNTAGMPPLRHLGPIYCRTMCCILPCGLCRTRGAMEEFRRSFPFAYDRGGSDGPPPEAKVLNYVARLRERPKGFLRRSIPHIPLTLVTNFLCVSLLCSLELCLQSFPAHHGTLWIRGALSLTGNGEGRKLSISFCGHCVSQERAHWCCF